MEEVIIYLLEKVDEEKKGRVDEEKEQANIKAYKDKINTIESFFKSNFSQFKCNLSDVSHAMNPETTAFLTDLFTVDGNLVDEPKKVCGAALMIAIGNKNMQQVVDSIRKFEELKQECQEKLRDSYLRLRESRKDTGLALIVNRIVKKIDAGQYKLSGNITSEDFEVIKALVDEADIAIEYKTDFFKKLSEQILLYKLGKRKLEAIVEDNSKQDMLQNNIFVETKDKTPQVKRVIKKAADYNYKNIIYTIEEIRKEFDGKISEPTIDETTAYDRDRMKLYYLPDSKNFDFNIVLYDYDNFLNQDRIEELYYSGKISPMELDIIRNVIYNAIVKEYENYLIRKKYFDSDDIDIVEIEVSEEKEEDKVVQEEVKTEQERAEEEKFVLIQKEIENITRETPVVTTQGKETTTRLEQPKLFINEKVTPLTQENLEIVNKAIAMSTKIKNDFSSKCHHSFAYLKSIYESGLCETYELDEGLVNIIVNLIPEFDNLYQEYRNNYIELRSFKDLDDEVLIEVFEDYKNDLVRKANEVISECELFTLDDDISKEESAAFLSERTNLVLADTSIIDGTSLFDGDLEYIRKVGQIDNEVLAKGFEEMICLDTNYSSSKSRKVKATLKKNVRLFQEQRPYRYRQSDLRYVYMLISVHPDNEKELRKKCNFSGRDFRLLYVQSVLYMKAHHEDYRVAEIRLSETVGIDGEQVGTVKWIRKIFGEKFTEETRKIAFQLVDQSEALKRAIAEGEVKKNEQKPGL